jgi:hypothetical protein
MATTAASKTRSRAVRQVVRVPPARPCYGCVPREAGLVRGRIRCVNCRVSGGGEGCSRKAALADQGALGICVGSNGRRRACVAQPSGHPFYDGARSPAAAEIQFCANPTRKKSCRLGRGSSKDSQKFVIARQCRHYPLATLAQHGGGAR